MNFFLYRFLLRSLRILRPRQLSTSRVSMSWHSPPFFNSWQFYTVILLYIRIQPYTTWENNQHFATLPLVSPRNDVWETTAEIPYWWRVTTQIWSMLFLLTDLAAREICFNQSGYRIRWRKKKTEQFIFHSYFFSQTALVDFADATLVSRTTLFILNENSGFFFNHDTIEFLHYTSPLATVVSKCPLKRGGGKSEVKICNTVNPTYNNLKFKNLSGWNFDFKHPSHRTISG